MGSRRRFGGVSASSRSIFSRPALACCALATGAAALLLAPTLLAALAVAGIGLLTIASFVGRFRLRRRAALDRWPIGRGGGADLAVKRPPRLSAMVVALALPGDRRVAGHRRRATDRRRRMLLLPALPHVVRQHGAVDHGRWRTPAAFRPTAGLLPRQAVSGWSFRTTSWAATYFHWSNRRARVGTRSTAA